MMDIVFYETWFTVNKGKINRRDEGLLVKKKRLHTQESRSVGFISQPKFGREQKLKDVAWVDI